MPGRAHFVYVGQTRGGDFSHGFLKLPDDAIAREMTNLVLRMLLRSGGGSMEKTITM